MVFVATYFFVLLLPYSDHHRMSSFVTKEWCEKVIELTRRHGLGMNPEFDGEPEYQLNFKGLNLEYPPIWNMVRPRIFPMIQRQIQEQYGGQVFPSETFGFVRRYKQGERLGISPHTDTTLYTATILLSDTSDFSGGDLYLYDRFRTSILRLLPRWKLLTTSLQFLLRPNYPKAIFEQGDLLIFEGSEKIGNFHGTIPLKSGERYVLVLFLPSKKEFYS